MLSSAGLRNSASMQVTLDLTAHVLLSLDAMINLLN